MSDRAFMWATATAAGVHVVGLASASVLLGGALAPTTTPIPIEVLTVPSPAPAPARPEPARPRASRRAAATQPALPRPALQPMPSTPAPPEAAAVPDTAPASRELLAGTPAVSSLPAASLPAGEEGFLLSGPGSPGGPIHGALMDDNSVAPAGPVVAGGQRDGTAARGPGRVGSVIGMAERGGLGESVAAVTNGTLALPVTVARPMAGYPTIPAYPESVRRLGLQGTTQLRFEVLASGRVGRIVVDKSAGHPDLDKAAADAAREWRFEPARRGNVPVTAWVSVPIRFELK